MKKLFLSCSLIFLSLILLCSAYLVFLQRPIKKEKQVSSFAPQDSRLMSVLNPDPSTEVEEPVYTKEHKRIFYLEEVGMCVDEDGKPLVTNGTNIIGYDEDKDALVDGANKTLSVFISSQLGDAYLMDGGSFVTNIDLDREIFMVVLKEPGLPERLIYCYRELRELEWWEWLPFVGLFTPYWDDYLYFDMNGRPIKTEYIADKDGFFDYAGKALFVILNLFTLGYYNTIMHGLVEFTDIREKTTLAQIRTLITHATQHPWQGLIAENGLPVVTQDGRVIRINPLSFQLCDNLGWSIYNTQTGMPVIFHNDDIITFAIGDFAVTQQAVVDNVLINASTIEMMLNNGTDIEMGTVTIPNYGTFSVPVMKSSGSNNYNFLNGANADGTINELHEWTEIQTNFEKAVKDMGSDISSMLKSVGDGVSNFFNELFDKDNGFLDAVKMIVVILVIILLFPVISLIVKLIADLISAVTNSFKKRSKNNGKKLH
jgi:hypothetical protein